MKAKLTALVVCEREDRLATASLVLDALSFRVRRARTCKEAASRLSRIPPPDLVLTDICFSDGDWRNVLDSSSQDSTGIPVIVFSPAADIDLYTETIERGAYDFITASFTVPEIVNVVRGALHRALPQRKHQTGQSPRRQGPNRNLTELSSRFHVLVKLPGYACPSKRLNTP